jgi:formate dehydrogenase subunit delta
MVRADLKRMANQIAANFRHHPQAQAAAEVADHIRMFWPPLMRHELLDNVDNGGFDPIVIAAADLLREAGTA